MDQKAIDLAIATAPRDRRPALETLFALDARLAGIVRTTSEGMIGRIRLAWWREALERLDVAPPPGEPLLAAIAARLLLAGVRGSELAVVAEGWEALLAGHSDDAGLSTAAGQRGGALFAAAGRVLGAMPPGEAGVGWALEDFADRLAEPAAAMTARRLAASALTVAFGYRFPRVARPLGVLALLAAFRLRNGSSPLRDAASLVGFRLTGRHRLEIGRGGDSLAV